MDRVQINWAILAPRGRARPPRNPIEIGFGFVIFRNNGICIRKYQD